MATPECRRTTLHHPLPLSRWDSAANTFTVDLHAVSHDIWHQLFDNMTYEEAILFVSIVMSRQQEGERTHRRHMARLRRTIMDRTNEEIILNGRGWRDPFPYEDCPIVLTGLHRGFHGPWLDFFGVPGKRGGLSTVGEVAAFIRVLMSQTKKVRRQDLLDLRHSIASQASRTSLAA